ncbi:MAG: DUF1559 domain-containing protein [Planctomycetaceae bacterium]|jgi:prepilin-type N-terminal cleavage/methylation domain-containing protein|nr:DUF1559 domain-containing protein [Planctomycetaceae bacterium]
MKTTNKFFGFTLVELLVVIAIIGVLIALLLPAVQAARESARRMSCSSNIKNIALSVHNYHAVYDSLPPGGIKNTLGTWAVLLLPYLEQQAFYAQYDLNQKYSSATISANQTISNADLLYDKRFAFYTCPSDSKRKSSYKGYSSKPGPWMPLHNYVVCAGNGSIPNVTWDTKPTGWVYAVTGSGITPRAGMFSPGVENYVKCYKMSEITDGLSNTLAFGESIQGYWEVSSGTENDLRGHIWWSGTCYFTGFLAPNSSSPDKGYNWLSNTLHPKDRFPIGPANATGSTQNYLASRSFHVGGVNTANGDGSAKFRNNHINIDTWRALSTAQGKEQTGE